MTHAAFLRQLAHWQRAIAPTLLHHSTDLPLSQFNQSFQSLVITLLSLAWLHQQFPDGFEPWQILEDSPAPYTCLRSRLNRVRACYHLALSEEGVGLPLQAEELRPLLHGLGGWIAQGAIALPWLGQTYEWLVSHPFTLDRSRSPARKIGGVYYTPSLLVEGVIADTVGSYFEMEPPSVPVSFSILDPSCGGGAFLLTAYQYLLNRYREGYLYRRRSALESPHPVEAVPLYQDEQGHWHLTPAEQERILINHLFGVDIDPGAVTVTQLSLWLKLLEERKGDRPLPNLDANIRCGNAIIGKDFEPQSYQGHTRDRPFEWSTAFPQVSQSGGFDVVVGNPPYVDSEWMTAFLPAWRAYCQTHYRTAVGNWDLFCIFVEKAFQVSRPGGRVGLVLPNKLASADYAAPVRSLLTVDHQLQILRDYSQLPVFSAAVYPLVVIAQHRPPDWEGTLRYEVVRSLQHPPDLHHLPYSAYGSARQQPPDPSPTTPRRSRPHPAWVLPRSLPPVALLNRLEQQFPQLRGMAQVVGAATVAEAYALRSLLEDRAMVEEGDLRVVNSGTIDRYCWLWGRKPLRYLGQTYCHPILRRSHLCQLSAKRQHQATHAKIVVAGMSRHLECMLDATGAIAAAKSTSLIRSELDLRYLLGVLNSRLVHFYVVHRFAGNQLKGGYLRIGPPQLRCIPLSVEESGDRSIYPRLIERVEERLRSADEIGNSPLLAAGTSTPISPAPISPTQIEAIETQIDHLVYALYQLTDDEINLVETIA